MYPTNDDQFEDVTVKTARRENGGAWVIERSDGFSFGVPADSPVRPEVGMEARFYGKGIGFEVRGLFLNGKKVFYRTVEEQDVHARREQYGADAAEWLRRWDAGQSVWSVEMGGLGPGYEQCIQITAAEALRAILTAGMNAEKWEDAEQYRKDRDTVDAALRGLPVIDKLGLSGAQHGAAMNLAACIFRRGPQCMADEGLKARRIQVSRNFPGA